MTERFARRIGGGKTTVRVTAYLCALLASAIWGQTGSSRLSGLVTDPTGGVAPGVVIAIEHRATGLQRSTSAGSSGFLSKRDSFSRYSEACASPRVAQFGLRDGFCGAH